MRLRAYLFNNPEARIYWRAMLKSSGKTRANRMTVFPMPQDPGRPFKQVVRFTFTGVTGWKEGLRRPYRFQIYAKYLVRGQGKILYQIYLYGPKDVLLEHINMQEAGFSYEELVAGLGFHTYQMLGLPVPEMTREEVIRLAENGDLGEIAIDEIV